MPLLIQETAFGIRAALRRSPPRMTIGAPILTREHAHDDDEADEHKNERDDPGGYPVVQLRGHGGTIRCSRFVCQ
jgi:hypothetical protein